MNLQDPHTQKMLARLLVSMEADICAIKAKVFQMSTQSDALAAGVADLGSKIQALNDGVVAHDSAVKAELVALAAAIAGSPAANDPAIQASIDKLGQLSTTVAANSATISQETTALVASLPPPATPAPDPAPAPSA